MAEKEKDELEKMNEALSMSEQFVEKYQKPLDRKSTRLNSSHSH